VWRSRLTGGAVGRDVGPSGTSPSDRGRWPGGAPGRIPGVDEPYGGGPSALEDLVALFEAGSAEELWRVLLMGGGLPSSPNSWDAGLVWRHHHDDGQPGALNTALLLCTDHRWRRATSGLIAAIASSGLLDADALAELARRFLEGVTVMWEAPAEWSEGPWIDIPLGPVEDVSVVADEAADVEVGPMLFPRRVPPPLHRWAAAELVRYNATAWAEVWEQAQTLDAAATGAALAGILDGLGALSELAASEMLAVGLSWGRGSVRLVALERLAEREGAGAARCRAAADPDIKIRQWAEKLGRPGRSSPARRGPSRPHADKPVMTETDTQPSLFDL
jgi:hypothetical protein